MERWNLIIKEMILFGIFGSIYYALELLYDGSSHWGMYVCAGLTGNLASYILRSHKHLNMLRKVLIVTGGILTLEYFSGYILNIWLKLNVWDYSFLPFNFQGQICLSFGLLWFFIFSPLILWLVPTLYWLIFDGEKPDSLMHCFIQLFTDIRSLFSVHLLKAKHY